MGDGYIKIYKIILGASLIYSMQNKSIWGLFGVYL